MDGCYLHNHACVFAFALYLVPFSFYIWCLHSVGAVWRRLPVVTLYMAIVGNTMLCNQIRLCGFKRLQLLRKTLPYFEVCRAPWKSTPNLKRLPSITEDNSLRSLQGEISDCSVNSASASSFSGVWRSRYLSDGMGHVFLNSSPRGRFGCETLPSSPVRDNISS